MVWSHWRDQTSESTAEQVGEIFRDGRSEGLYELAKEAMSLEISVPEDEEKENPKVIVIAVASG